MQVLMEPLTPAEVAFNRESSPDLHKLPSYPVAFSPAVLGEPSQMCFLQLRNSGDLPSSFSIHLPNERYTLENMTTTTKKFDRKHDSSTCLWTKPSACMITCQDILLPKERE